MASRKSDTALKALFIGNSFTARNNLLCLIEQVATAQGLTFQYHLINAGGASLRRHWNGGSALKAIEDGKYDCIVLQEQSTLPIKNAERMHENVRMFEKAIKEAGAKTVLYMTWARQRAPESQADITAAYHTIGKELNATVVPVGVAWQNFQKKHEASMLFDRDQSHPTLAGSYLAACVFLSTLFQVSPVGNTAEIAGLEAKHRLVLQTAAWQVCGFGKRKSRK